jgi:hypothetical protein
MGHTFAPILGQFTEFPRGNVSMSAQVTFPAGGLTPSDQKPVLNWALSKYPFSARVGGYIDIGATDPGKDLDDWDDDKVVPLYVDEAIPDDGPSQLAGVNPPKAIFMRCLAGSGFVYINIVPGDSSPVPPPPFPEKAKQAVFPLHAGVGMIYYTFPKKYPGHCLFSSDDGSIPPVTTKIMIPICIVDIGLRTFEDSNRFQLEIFR